MRALLTLRNVIVFGVAVCSVQTASVAAEPTASRLESARRGTLVVLTPGTKVPGPRPLPSGWTHFIIKSVPRLSTGELNTLPDVANATAGLFHATLLADVRPTGDAAMAFELRRVGLGLCTPVNGVDTVVSSTTVSQLQVALGFVGRRVLAEAERELLRGRVKAQTPTFVLFSAPSIRKAKRGHEEVLLRYALLVDPHDGSLQTVLWSQSRDPRTRTAPDRLYLLAPDLVFDASLDVLAGRVLNTVPVNWSFALNDLPPGKVLAPTATIQSLSLRDTLGPSDAATLEVELRRVLAAAAATHRREVRR